MRGNWAGLNERFLFKLPLFSHFTVDSRKQLDIGTTALVQQHSIEVSLFRVDVDTGPSFPVWVSRVDL